MCQLCNEENVLTILNCGLKLAFGVEKKKKKNKISKSDSIVFMPGLFLNVGTIVLRNMGLQLGSLSSASPDFTL